jgi:hypothetical protein
MSKDWIDVVIVDAAQEVANYVWSCPNVVIIADDRNMRARAAWWKWFGFRR